MQKGSGDYNITLGGENDFDESMMNPFNINQRSKLEVSCTSLISKHDLNV
jgi:hypothetical protein